MKVVVLYQPMQEDFQPKFNKLNKNIFEIKGKDILIGGEIIKPEFLGILKEQAQYLSTSQLYEVYIDTLQNEAMNLSLIQSKDWEDVQFAKALWHCVFVLENMVNGLKKQ